MTTDNNPNIILTLVAVGVRAIRAWADPHNESFYLPELPQATDGGRREVVESSSHADREVTPSIEDPDREKSSEPALQITFDQRPRNPELGYTLGSDRKQCDIFLGSTGEGISSRMFTLSFNQHNEIIMKSSAKNETVVSYGKQKGGRKNFTWIFPQDQRDIFVAPADRIRFSVVVSKHETDKVEYEANCRTFMTLTASASQTINLLNLSSLPNTGTAGKAEPPLVTMERPFYLRTGKLGQGGFGTVYKARSMPNGEVVALKQFKSNNAWTLEANVLRKLSETPHANIVKLLDFGQDDKPFLAMGLALKGNLEEEHKIVPFNAREISHVLRQMLHALVYLHFDFGITHRDIKPANILCDSRAHFRLADFGIAKEGDILKTFSGTQPYMAPEMFARKRYTSAVDLWALGLVIAGLLSPNRPPDLKGNEGVKYCAGVVALFRKYEECFRAIGNRAPEQEGLNYLVGQHMLRMKPEERESAVGCLNQGKNLWRMLDQDSDDGSKTPTREDPTGSHQDMARAENANGSLKDSRPPDKGGASDENGVVQKRSWSEEDGVHNGGEDAPLGENIYTEDNESEAETEISEVTTLKSADWQSLERQFPDKNGKGGQHHFMHAPPVDLSGHVPEHSTTPGSHGQAEASSRPVSPAAPMGVQKRVHKRKTSSMSKSAIAAAAKEAAGAQ